MLQISNLLYKFDPSKEYPSYDTLIKYFTKYIENKLKTKLLSINLYKKSLDFRHGSCSLNLSFIISCNNEDKYIGKNITKYNYVDVVKDENNYNHNKKNIIVVGSGPSGLFTTLILSENNMNVTLVEMGKKVEDRVIDVEEFFKTGILNETSNIQFGEGGAGTFSDGKLYTGGNNPLNRYVLETFVRFGANKDILYEAHPHVGTDELRKILVNIRNYLLSKKVKIFFNNRLIDFDNDYAYFESNEISKLPYDKLIFATGHSSFDTYKLLNSKNILMEPKNFAVGVRIEHKRVDVNKSMYHGDYPLLPAAIYKFVEHLDNERSVYSFCMCPGGEVVNVSCEKGYLLVNGMSNRNRDFDNSNSALLVDVKVSDYYKDSIFDGINYIHNIEKNAYNKCMGKVPVQKVSDFIEGKTSTNLGKVIPSIRSSYELSNIKDILPNYVYDSLVKGIDKISNKATFFKDSDAVITGVETRTSSPIKVLRNELYKTNIDNVYAIGEGSGHAGGIVTSATDGIKVSLEILKELRI